jgi:hypothetical protein
MSDVIGTLLRDFGFGTTHRFVMSDSLRDPAALYSLDSCALSGLHSQPLLTQEGNTLELRSSWEAKKDRQYCRSFGNRYLRKLTVPGLRDRHRRRGPLELQALAA